MGAARVPTPKLPRPCATEGCSRWVRWSGSDRCVRCRTWTPDRLLALTDPAGDCRLWPTRLGSYGTGYGRVMIASPAGHKHPIAVHRLMAALSYGLDPLTLPARLVVRHRDDCAKRCIAPDHLIVGTQADNVLDMLRAGNNPHAFRDGRCWRGHDITDPANVYVVPGTGDRRCEACQRDRQRARRAA